MYNQHLSDGSGYNRHHLSDNGVPAVLATLPDRPFEVRDLLEMLWDCHLVE